VHQSLAVTFQPDLNVARAAEERQAARAAGDEARAALLDALVGCGGLLLVFEPERDHYCVLFGDLAEADHVAVMVPGVGDVSNLAHDWLPSAQHLFDAAESTAVFLWKGYDNPKDLLAAAAESIECGEELLGAGRELTDFVGLLPVRPDQSLTLVAHSFGSFVTGAALADCGLQCTDVVVAGSPGMTVDELKQLHVKESHFFSEEAPGDAIALLGVFGAAPTSPTFGGTRMRTNKAGHVEVLEHSSYFVPGSEALANIVRVVTGRYGDVVVHHTSVAERAGAFVTWAMRIPTFPLQSVRRYRGPGFRVLMNARRVVDLASMQTGNLVRDALDECGRGAGWVRHHLVD